MTLPPPEPRSSRWTFPRSRDDRLLTGTAAGVAARLGVEPIVVRAAFLVLALAAGAGALLYLIAFSASTAPDPASPAVPAPPGDPVLAVALGLITLGLLLACRGLNIWTADALVFPAAAVAAGACVLWSAAPDRSRSRRQWPPVSRLGRIPLSARTLGGAVLVAAGLSYFAAGGVSGEGVVTVVVAAALAVGGTALVFGPWLQRLLTDLNAERRERIRSEERAEVAAHLHDSVLQTLALIQRGAAQGKPHEVVQLARRQERELRAWLYGDRGAPAGAAPATDGDRLAAEVAAIAVEVEADHAVTVDVVVVGDGPVDAPTAALLAATREAVVNAAKHAEVGEVSVFVEAGERDVTAFVRDRGKGFDPEHVPGDRHGIAQSIRGRVERHGGRVVLTSEPGAGTEVELHVPRLESPKVLL